MGKGLGRIAPLAKRGGPSQPWAHPFGVCVLIIPADSADRLQLYAQLALTFAGFAGVIGAFSQFRIHAEATSFRVRSMVALGVGICMMALLPLLLDGFGLTAITLWRACGGLLAMIALGLLVFLGSGASRLYREGRLMRGAAYVLIAIGVAAAAPLGAASAGLVGLPVEPLYFALLFFGLLVCAYHFVMLIWAVRLNRDE